MAINHAANAGRHAIAERGLDLYETPPEATIALLKHEPLPQGIWEPCCGKGAIVRVLQDAGHEVMASDIRRYNCNHGLYDFLRDDECDVPCIVTNPPYNKADEFVRHALQRAGKVVMLLRWAFMESEKRTGILEGAGLVRILLFRKRLPMMHRAGWTGRRTTSSIPFAWFVWVRGYEGNPTVQRISWRPIDGPHPDRPGHRVQGIQAQEHRSAERQEIP